MLLALASVCSSCSFPVDSDLVPWKVKELFGSFLVLLIQFYILCDVYNASKIERCVRWYKEVIYYAICLRKNSLFMRKIFEGRNQCLNCTPSCIHCENINVQKIFYGNSSIHINRSDSSCWKFRRYFHPIGENLFHPQLIASKCFR